MLHYIADTHMYTYLQSVGIFRASPFLWSLCVCAYYVLQNHSPSPLPLWSDISLPSSSGCPPVVTMATVLRLSVSTLGATRCPPGPAPLLCAVRGLRSHGPLRCKAPEKAAEAPKGVPYNRLSIGVPKEIWQNERR